MQPQAQPHLRGLPGDNKTTHVKCSSYCSPPCPERLAVLKCRVLFLAGGNKAQSSCESLFLLQFAHLQRTSQTPFLLNTAGQSSGFLPSSPVHRWPCLCSCSSGHDPQLRCCVVLAGILFYPFCAHLCDSHTAKRGRRTSPP